MHRSFPREGHGLNVAAVVDPSDRNTSFPYGRGAIWFRQSRAFARSVDDDKVASTFNGLVTTDLFNQRIAPASSLRPRRPFQSWKGTAGITIEQKQHLRWPSPRAPYAYALAWRHDS
jgi:hypothetical protein